MGVLLDAVPEQPYSVAERLDALKCSARSTVRMANRRKNKKLSRTGERLLMALLDDSPHDRLTLEQLFHTEYGLASDAVTHAYVGEFRN